MTETLDNIKLRINATYQQIINLEKHIAELEAELEGENKMNTKTQISKLIEECKENANNHGWKIYWNKISTDKHDLSIGDALALCHSEISEALEAFRDNDFEHFDEEIADEFIRLFHLCGDLNIDIEKAIEEKMNKNSARPKNHGRVNF